MATKISGHTAIALNRASSMAPSQKAKMERIEYVSSSVFTATVHTDFVKSGIQFHAGERMVLVRSDRFAGWYYLVRWTNNGIEECSCGKPHGCVHTHAACAFTHTYKQPVKVATPVVESEPVQVEESVMSDAELDAIDPENMTPEQWQTRVALGLRRQAEADRKYREDYTRKLAAIKANAVPGIDYVVGLVGGPEPIDPYVNEEQYGEWAAQELLEVG